MKIVKCKQFAAPILVALLLVGALTAMFKPVRGQGGSWVTIFSSDFEGADDEWTGTVIQGSGSSVDLNATHLPIAGLEHGEYNFTGGSHVGAYSYVTFEETYYSMMFSAWYSMNNTAGWRKMVEFRTPSDNLVLSLFYAYGVWRTNFYNTTAQESESPLTISPDTYQNITIEHFLNETGGYHKVYINETQIFNLDNLNNTVFGGIHELRVGSPTQTDTYNDVSVRVDDVIVRVLVQTYTLTITTTAGGTTNPSPDQYVHDAGTNVSVTANADANYVFLHWELDSINIGSVNPYSVLMDGNHTLRAVFALETYTLTITATAGGTTNPAPGTYNYTVGSNVEVQALASADNLFDHWVLDGSPVGSENPISILIDENHTLHAVFSLINYTLTITTTEGGTTSPAPNTYTYASGSSVPVTAIPEATYVFDHWELDNVNVGADNPYPILMDDDHELHAVFMIHNVAIENVTLSQTIIGQGYNLNMNITVTNLGDYTEVFNVTVSVDTVAVVTEEVQVNNRTSTVLTVTWNTTGFAKGNYTLSVYAEPVPDEANTTDNTFIYGSIYVGTPGDLNADGKVDMRDIGSLAIRFISAPGDPLWEPNHDLNNDGKIDMYDVGTAAKNFGL